MKIVLLAYILSSIGYLVSGQDCPRQCQCVSNKGELEWACLGNEISENNLKTFGTFGVPGNVIELTLRGNNLSSFPVEAFENFTRLERLDLGKNQVSSFPKNLSAYLPALTEIKLDQNKLTALNVDDFIGYEKIEQLDIFQNQIKELPANVFTRLVKLRKFFLEKNEISKVSIDSLNGLSNLFSFSLQGNKLTEIPIGLFENKNKLRIFWVSANPLKSISGNLFKGSNIYKLYINNAELTDNKVERNAFSGLVLDLLDLRNNNLTTLKQEWFDDNSVPYITKLNENPVNCDCHLFETFQAWHNIDNAIKIEGTCKTPSTVSGESIMDVLTKNEAECDACSLNKCQNNATCNVMDTNSYECKCSVFNYGNFCQYDELCIHKPCMNNATCTNHNSSHFSCNCTEGYIGDVCGIEKPCYFRNPCINNGTCNVAGSDYFCNCTDDYNGKNCDNLITDGEGDNGLKPGWVVLIVLALLTLTVIIAVLVYKTRKVKSTDSTDFKENTPLKTEENV